jgi:hypothetical protein
MSRKEKIPASSWSGKISEIIKSDPIPAGCVIVVLIGFLISEPAAALSTFTGVALLGLAFYFYNSRSSTKLKTDKQTNETSRGGMAATLKNVWEVGQSKMGGDATKKSHDDKPFGSKYYYAHNNSGATGGYKDGLKMEDYRMNGPRLLSKGGQEVEDTSATSEGNILPAPTVAPPKTRILAQDPSIKNITKYLWDDPGDYNGIATIRIDSLPSKNDKFVDWKDVKVEDITADLPGEGLLVKIVTDQGKFQLKINKLYGDAAAVKTVSKSKRLLVRIYKKKNAVLAVMDTSNLDAWPQPHRKI